MSNGRIIERKNEPALYQQMPFIDLNLGKDFGKLNKIVDQKLAKLGQVLNLCCYIKGRTLPHELKSSLQNLVNGLNLVIFAPQKDYFVVDGNGNGRNVHEKQNFGGDEQCKDFCKRIKEKLVAFFGSDCGIDFSSESLAVTTRFSWTNSLHFSHFVSLAIPQSVDQLLAEVVKLKPENQEISFKISSLVLWTKFITSQIESLNKSDGMTDLLKKLKDLFDNFIKSADFSFTNPFLPTRQEAARFDIDQLNQSEVITFVSEQIFRKTLKPLMQCLQNGEIRSVDPKYLKMFADLDSFYKNLGNLLFE